MILGTNTKFVVKGKNIIYIMIMKEQNLKENLKAEFAKLLTSDKARQWESDHQNDCKFLSPSLIDQGITLLCDLKNFKYDFYSSALIRFELKQIDDKKFLNIRKYFSSSDFDKLMFSEKMFKNMTGYVREQAQAKGIDKNNNVIDEVCRLISHEGENMFLILDDERVLKGKLKVEPDRIQYVYHFIQAQGIKISLMQTKAVVLTKNDFASSAFFQQISEKTDQENMQVIYYTPFLDQFPPRQAYQKKFGQSVEFEFLQETYLSEK